jgi:hypothetical protein
MKANPKARNNDVIRSLEAVLERRRSEPPHPTLSPVGRGSAQSQ